MWQVIFRILARLLAGGRAAGRVVVSRYGRITFRGLIRNRPLGELTQQEVRNAFREVGLREMHSTRSSHFISRLIDRGPRVGIRTLDDFARALTNGTAQVGKNPGTIDIVIPNGRAVIVVQESTGYLITFSPL